MNLASVTGADGELLPYARHLLDTMAFFPDDERSRSFLREILEQEHAEYSSVGAETYKPSKVASVLMNYSANRSQQVWVCGLVALAVFGFHALGKRASQNAAVRHVAEATGKSNKESFVYFDAGSGEFFEKGVRLQSDPDSIRQVFKTYRSAAHICAARVTCAPYLEPLKPFEPAREADRYYLSTVIAFQHVFQKQMDLQSWGLRLVGMPPGLLEDAPPLYPTTGQMEELLGEQALGPLCGTRPSSPRDSNNALSADQDDTERGSVPGERS